MAFAPEPAAASAASKPPSSKAGGGAGASEAMPILLDKGAGKQAQLDQFSKNASQVIYSVHPDP